MLYREIIVVCSQIHTKHINTLCVLYVIKITGPDLIRRPLCFEVYRGIRHYPQVNAALPFVTLSFDTVPEKKQPFQLRSSCCSVQGKQ